MMQSDLLTDSEIQTYFHRLGLERPSAPVCDSKLLCRLQYAHVTRIPFENLDILSGIALPMTRRGQFNKVVLGRRGGYCFELNGLFACLLASLGYPVTSYLGRYLRDQTEIPMRRHRVTRVECAGTTWLCDVAVGQQSPRVPLRLEPDLVQEQYGETYRFTREPFLGWVLYDHHNGQWRRFYSFTEEEQLDVDFVAPSFYCEKAPDSIFNKAPMLSIKTEEGRKTLDGHTFRVFSSSGVHEEVITEPGRLLEILDSQFNIGGADETQACVWLSAGKSVR